MNISHISTQLRRNICFTLALMAVILCVALIANVGKAESSDFNLASLNNPILGKWQSDIPGAGGTLIFDFKADGTFDYEMGDIPADEGGVGTGAYIVAGNIMVSYLEFEGAEAYIIEVVDNNTINATEILSFNEDGSYALGNSAPFIRVEGGEVIAADIPTVIDSVVVGAWNALLPEDGEVADCNMYFDANGVFRYEIKPDIPISDDNYYTVLNDVIVFWYPDYRIYECFSFAAVDGDTLDVTEITGIAEDGARIAGEYAQFHRIAK